MWCRECCPTGPSLSAACGAGSVVLEMIADINMGLLLGNLVLGLDCDGQVRLAFGNGAGLEWDLGIGLD